MTSKDKLIEFLKSANIEYEVTKLEQEVYISTDTDFSWVEYVFNLDGNYLRTDVY